MMTTRRVVTGIDADGKSYVVHDGPTPGSVDLGAIILDDIWVDDPANPDPEAAGDPVAGSLSLVGPPGGSVIRSRHLHARPTAPTCPPTMTSPPTLRGGMPAAPWKKVMPATRDGTQPRRSTTASSSLGSSILVSTTVGCGWGPGDVVVQRATRHAWRPVGDEPCKIAWILVSSPNYS